MSGEEKHGVFLSVPKLFCLCVISPLFVGVFSSFHVKMCDLNDNPIKLSVKWNGKEFDIPEFSPSDSVAMLKVAIENATGVRPERQKLLNVKFQGNCGIFCLITVSHPLLTHLSMYLPHLIGSYKRKC